MLYWLIYFLQLLLLLLFDCFETIKVNAMFQDGKWISVGIYRHVIRATVYGSQSRTEIQPAKWCTFVCIWINDDARWRKLTSVYMQVANLSASASSIRYAPWKLCQWRNASLCPNQEWDLCDLGNDKTLGNIRVRGISEVSAFIFLSFPESSRFALRCKNLAVER